MRLTQSQTPESIALSSERQAIMEVKNRLEAFSKLAMGSSFFRKMVLRNQPWRHMLRFFINIIIFILLIGAQRHLWKMSPLFAIIAYPLHLYVLGLIISSFVIHSHEFTHHHIKIRWLNDLLGVATGALAFVNFYGFRQAHLQHHINIGNLDTPEAGAPVSPKGQAKIRMGDRTRNRAKKIADRSPLLWLFVAWPLFIYDGDYNSWLMPFRHKDRIDRRSLAVFIAILSINLSALVLFPVVYLFLYLPAVVLGGNRFIAMTYLHHAYHGAVFFNDEHHNYYNVIMANTDRDFGLVLNFFIMNNGFHIAHHLNPQIAYYDLKKTSGYLRSIFPTDLKYPYFPKSSLYRDLKHGKYDQRNASDQEFFYLKIPPF
jgi:fatty acid desaturase